MECYVIKCVMGLRKTVSLCEFHVIDKYLFGYWGHINSNRIITICILVA